MQAQSDLSNALRELFSRPSLHRRYHPAETPNEIVLSLKRPKQISDASNAAVNIHMVNPSSPDDIGLILKYLTESEPLAPTVGDQAAGEQAANIDGIPGR
jgi:hypothetical protein